MLYLTLGSTILQYLYENYYFFKLNIIVLVHLTQGLKEFPKDASLLTGMARIHEVMM